MIANEKQLEITRGAIRRFQHGIDNHPAEPPKDVDPVIHQASLDAQISMLDELTDQIALFLRWSEFMKGEWIQTVPQLEGSYATMGRLDRQEKDWNIHVVFKHPETGVFTCHPRHGGFFWSVPFPGLPVPAPWIDLESAGLSVAVRHRRGTLEIHDVSIVDKCPYCGEKFDKPGTKRDGSVCNHPTKFIKAEDDESRTD